MIPYKQITLADCFEETKDFAACEIDPRLLNGLEDLIGDVRAVEGAARSGAAIVEHEYEFHGMCRTHIRIAACHDGDLFVLAIQCQYSLCFFFYYVRLSIRARNILSGNMFCPNRQCSVPLPSGHGH